MVEELALGRFARRDASSNLARGVNLRFLSPFGFREHIRSRPKNRWRNLKSGPLIANAHCLAAARYSSSQDQSRVGLILREGQGESAHQNERGGSAA